MEGPFSAAVQAQAAVRQPTPAAVVVAELGEVLPTADPAEMEVPATWK
jgi:hypothetical protein